MSVERNDIKEYIKNYIGEAVKSCSCPELYRAPIVGFADADDPLYGSLCDAEGKKLLTPKDILSSARTVTTFFIPYAEEVAEAMLRGDKINQLWSDAYSLTNLLLAEISDGLIKELAEKGIRCADEPPTMNYDPVNLTARWSHKSSAVIAGIGTFGMNRLIITRSGTMGRLGSLILDKWLEPDQRPSTEYCLYRKNGSCGVCMKRCPSGAIKPDGFDRFRCNAYLDGKNISDYEQGCAMCSSGPCAVKGFV